MAQKFNRCIRHLHFKANQYRKLTRKDQAFKDGTRIYRVRHKIVKVQRADLSKTDRRGENLEDSINIALQRDDMRLDGPINHALKNALQQAIQPLDAIGALQLQQV